MAFVSNNEEYVNVLEMNVVWYHHIACIQYNNNKLHDYSNTNDSGGNIAWQAMSETSGLMVNDFYGGSYSRTMFYDMTFYPKVNSSQDRSAYTGNISYNGYNSGNGGWYATSTGGFYNTDTDLSGGGLQIECNTSYDYVTMSLYGVKLT